MKTELRIPDIEKLVDRRSEFAVLKAMICEPDTYIPQVQKLVTGEDFATEEGQLLFSQILDLFAKKAVDIIILKDQLKNDGVYDQIDGYDTLESVLNSTPTHVNTEYYCKKIKELSIHRQLHKTNNNIAAVVSSGESLSKKIEQIQTLTANIKTPKQSGSFTIAERIKNHAEAVISGRLGAIKLPYRLTSFLSNALMPGSLTLICGNAGASKSFMLLECLAFWHNRGIKIACYELEESLEFWLFRAIAQKAGIAELTNLDWVKENPDIVREITTDYEDFTNSFGTCLDVEPESQLTQQQIANWIESKARQGNRIIAVDPITATAQTRESWIADNNFLQNIKRTATNFQCSIILITHPVKSVSFADMNQLAGSAAYARFAQSILWLENHEPKESNIKTDCGTAEIEHDKTLHILKSRNGTGQGKRIAFEFANKNLTFRELGLISKGQK